MVATPPGAGSKSWSAAVNGPAGTANNPPATSEHTSGKRVPTPVLVVLLWLLWSSVFVAVKIGLRTAPPESFAALRALAAATALLFASFTLPNVFGHMTRVAHGYALVLGATNVTGLFLLQTFGMRTAGVGLSAMLLYTQPLLVAVLARALLGEVVTRRKLLGLLVGWAGIVLLVRGELRMANVGWAAVGFLLLAAVSWGIGTVVVKMAPEDVSIWQLLLWQNIYGTTTLWLAILLLRPEVPLHGQVLTSAVWAGLAGGAAGFAVQFILLRRGEASTVSAWIFPVPVISAVAGVVLLGEPVHGGLVVGGASVACGIYLVNTGRAPPPLPASE